MDTPACPCLNEPLAYNHYRPLRFVGIDPAAGRYGEVNIWQCLACGRLWLHYLLEQEAFTGSGRYFMGLISAEEAGCITPNEAFAYLNRLEWRLFGGSYFGRKGRTSLPAG